MTVAIAPLLPTAPSGTATAEARQNPPAVLDDISLLPAGDSAGQTALPAGDALASLVSHYPVVATACGVLLAGAGLVRAGIVSHARLQPVNHDQQVRAVGRMQNSTEDTGFSLAPISGLFERADLGASSIHPRAEETFRPQRHLWVAGAFMRGMPVMVTIADETARADFMLDVVNSATGRSFSNIAQMHGEADAPHGPDGPLELRGADGTLMVRICGAQDASCASTDGLTGQYVIGRGPYYVELDIAPHSERGMRLQLVDRLPPAMDGGHHLPFAGLLHRDHHKGPLGPSDADAFVCLRIKSSLQ